MIGNSSVRLHDGGGRRKNGCMADTTSARLGEAEVVRSLSRSVLSCLTSIAVTIGTAFHSVAPAHAQPLVIEGEEIASAELMAAARKERGITVFGVFPESSMALVAPEFRKDTGLTLDFVRLTTQRMHLRVTAEHAAGKLEADIVDLTDLPLIQDLIDKGILARPHRVPWFDRLAPAVRDPEGRWYAMFRPSSTVSINTSRTRPEEVPTSWLDVLDPRWQGRIGMPTIDAGGSAFTVYTFVRDRIAPDFWTRLAANKPRIYPSIVQAAQDLARGETAMVIGGPDSMFEQIRAGAPIKVLFLKEGLSAFPIAGGIYTRSKRPSAAAVYLNWVTSRRGGRSITQAGAYAAHPEVAPPRPAGVEFPPLTQLWNIDPSYWTKVRESYSTEWRKAFGQR